MVIISKFVKIMQFLIISVEIILNNCHTNCSNKEETMKKSLLLLLMLVLTLTACSSGGKAELDAKEIEELVIFFVPSRDPEEIIQKTEPLKGLITDAMKERGYTVDKVRIEVSPNYEAAGEAMDAGKAHIGFVPASTYVTYAGDNVDVILAASRNGLNKDSVNAKDWNDGLPTLDVDEQVTFYRSLIIAGTSAKGQELGEIVNSGQDLTWDDVNDAMWCHMSTTSSAGYVYPSIWLADKFDGKKISDLDNKVEAQSYPDIVARLANGQCDVGMGFVDIRADNADAWVTEYGKEDIWKDTNVIGVTGPIMNDTISISTKLIGPETAKALQEVFIEIAQTEEGQEAISIYNHTAYKVVTDSDYDESRRIFDLLKSMD